MKLKIELPVYGHFTTNRNADRLAIGKELVEVDVPEYSNSDIFKVLSFTTGTSANLGNDLHEYFAVGSKLIQNSGVALDGDSILNPKYCKSRSEDDNHPFVRNVFKSIYEQTSYCKDFAKWGSKSVMPKDLASFLDGLYSYISDPEIDFIDLHFVGKLPLKNLDSEIIDRQILNFKKEMENFIIVEGVIYKSVPEPILSIGDIRGPDCTFVGLSQFGVDSRNTRDFVQEISNKITSADMYFSFVDFDKIDEKIWEEYGDGVSSVYNVGNVDVCRPDLLNANYAPLTVIKKSIDLARNFMDGNIVSQTSGVGRYTGFQKKFRNLPIEELGLYQDLMNAIDNASPFEITPELDDCIAGIKNLYAPGVEKTSFGNRKLVDRVSEIIEDSVIDPVEKFSNSTVSFK